MKSMFFLSFLACGLDHVCSSHHSQSRETQWLSCCECSPISIRYLLLRTLMDFLNYACILAPNVGQEPSQAPFSWSLSLVIFQGKVLCLIPLWPLSLNAVMLGWVCFTIPRFIAGTEVERIQMEPGELWGQHGIAQWLQGSHCISSSVRMR